MTMKVNIPYTNFLVFILLLLPGVVCQQDILGDDHDDDGRHQLSVSIEPVGPTIANLNEAVAHALEVCQVREALNGTRHRLLSSQFLSSDLNGKPYGHAKDENDMFQAAVYDYTAGRTLIINGIPFDPETISFATANIQPLVSFEELEEAARIAKIGVHVPFQGGMPPTINRTFANGTSHRVVHIQTSSGNSSRSIYVNLSNGTVEYPPEHVERLRACQFIQPGPGPAVSGAPGTANVYISQGGRLLWSFKAIRPTSSSGHDGSALELKNVQYKGKTVLYNAGAPILNVLYDPGAACGPQYRDWEKAEWPFVCDGTDVAPGFRLCKTPARTILDPPFKDEGTFTGVAVYIDGPEVVLKSQLVAGWYRYISEWRFHVDGTLKPRFGFGGTSSCVCDIHHHHVYWRLDFDIVTPGNNLVREFNKPPIFDATNYHDKMYEIRRPKDPQRQRHWEVSNTRTGDTYGLFPGSNDGTLDTYGVGDLWVLRYHFGEIDDFPAPGTKANIDKFLNGELVKDKDVVLWYGAHFTHDQVHDEIPHIVGPDIRPLRW